MFPLPVPNRFLFQLPVFFFHLFRASTTNCHFQLGLSAQHLSYDWTIVFCYCVLFPFQFPVFHLTMWQSCDTRSHVTVLVFISLFSLTPFLFDFFWGYPSPLLSPPPEACSQVTIAVHVISIMHLWSFFMQWLTDDFTTPHPKQWTAPFFLLGKMTHVLLCVKLWNADSGCHCTKPSYDHLIKGSLMLDDDEKLCYLIVRSKSFYKLSNLNYVTSKLLVMHFKSACDKWTSKHSSRWFACDKRTLLNISTINQIISPLTKCRMSGQ